MAISISGRLVGSYRRVMRVCEEEQTVKFGVIFTADWPKDDDGFYLFAWNRHPDLAQTEGDEQADYEYLGDRWMDHHHVKLVGVLDKQTFCGLVQDFSLWPGDTETMGSIGVPWGGWAPAIAYDGFDDYSSAIVGAYVTPLPDVLRDGGWSLHDWERVRCAVIKWSRRI